jgi:hypothetical protein
MIIYVDIDNTICKTKGMDYLNAVPKKRKIKKVNKLYRQGHRVMYWTARGQGSGIKAEKERVADLTLAQLEKWGCKYHGVKFDKPIYDKFYCDKAGKL